jgi:hypothetical protein
MKITATNVITTGVQVMMTLALGFFILTCAFFMVSESLDAKKNFNQVEQLVITDTGRLHVYDGLDFTVGPADYGVPRKCVIVTSDTTGSVYVQDATVAVPGDKVIPSDFCVDAILDHSSNWQSHAPAQPNGFGERLFGTVIALAVLLAGGYLIMQIPALLIASVYLPAYQYVKLITIAFMLPIFIFIGIFVHSIWSYTPSYWVTPDNKAVKTTSVYISGDGSLYKAPDTLYDWTESETGDKLPERIR